MLKKKTIEVIMIALMGTVLYLASSTSELNSEPIVTAVVEEMVEPDTPRPTIVANKKIVVTQTVDVQPLYYINVSDGYISEESLRSICEYVGNMYDIQPELLQAIAYTESHYYVYATGYSNDKGLCQIVDKWHRDRMVELEITDIYDPYSNVLLCADIINDLKSNVYGNDIRFLLMAYNMGENTAARHYAAGTISEYAQTVMTKYRELISD